jgi:hypothetical protein
MGVKAVLEERSPKYQQLMAFQPKTERQNFAVQQEQQKSKGKSAIQEELIKEESEKTKISKPIVIPQSVNKTGVKRLIKETAQKPIEPIEKIEEKGLSINITGIEDNDYISLTDLARIKNSKEPKDVVKNWMRTRSTLEFLGLWEKMNNPEFRGVDFEPLLSETGKNAFTMSPTKWIETTGAIGIVCKSGRYGGTYAHSDIAFEFASWISAEFKLYIIMDYKRLKADENSRFSLNWNLNREISKLNYKIHTDAIKENLIPPELTPAQISFTYANEADMLNVVLFGRTTAGSIFATRNFLS